MPLSLSRLIRKQRLLDPPTRQVPLHAVSERIHSHLAVDRCRVEPQQRLDNDLDALVAAGGTETRLVENGNERSEEGEERGDGDERGRGREGGEVGEENDLQSTNVSNDAEGREEKSNARST